MNIIAWAMIIVGGIMVYAGIKKDNPITVVKGVLSGGK